MFKKIFILSVIAADVSCLAMPEAGVTYQIDGENLVKAPDNFQTTDKIGKNSAPESEIDLGIFALCYKNYQNQPSFNRDYLESVFNSISGLSPEVSVCAAFVIDDSEEEVLAETADLIRVCKEFNKMNVPVYINWNGCNLGIEQSRDKLLNLVRLFETKYIFLADSDDILHPNCLPAMYQTMKNNENLYLLLGEYSLLGYCNNRPSDIEQYKDKQPSADAFELKFFSKDSGEGDNNWISVSDRPAVIKKVPDSPNKGNGYLPAMIKYFDQIPAKCEETDGNMLMWYSNIVRILEAAKPGCDINYFDIRRDPSIKDNPQYALLTPLSEESFLYFYRLYSTSNSHEGYTEASDIKILHLSIQLICFLNREDVSTESVIGTLIKEFCPLQNMIDCGINGFDLSKLPEECCIKLIIKDKMSLINEYARSFWEMMNELCGGGINGVENWIKQFKNKVKAEDINFFRSLNSILDGYFESLKESEHMHEK